jgi:hypothetical protein
LENLQIYSSSSNLLPSLFLSIKNLFIPLLNSTDPMVRTKKPSEAEQEGKSKQPVVDFDP